jgi:hypothetical protein
MDSGERVLAALEHPERARATGGRLDGGCRGHGVRTQSLLMALSTRRVRGIDSIHLSKRADVKVRFFWLSPRAMGKELRGTLLPPDS